MLTTAPQRSPISTSFFSLFISTRLLRIKRILGQQIPLNLLQLQRGQKAQIYDTSQPSYQGLMQLRAAHLLNVHVGWIILTSGDDFILFSASNTTKEDEKRQPFILLMQDGINNDHVAIMTLAYNCPGTSAGLHPLLLIILLYVFLIKLFFKKNCCHFLTSHYLLKKRKHSFLLLDLHQSAMLLPGPSPPPLPSS